MPSNLPLYVTVNPVRVATRVILEVMRTTETVSHSHPPGSWTFEGEARHLQHAFEHMELVYTQLVNGEPISQADVDHALCRLAMAVDCRDQGLVADMGEEGKGTD